MDLKEIQEMFSEMGLGSPEQRNKLVKELSINVAEYSYDKNYDIKISSNTLKPEQYA